jgi:hypothetical protein
MATKLTKKQQSFINKVKAVQLRLSPSETVNDMTVNQVSTQLNVIHREAIGKAPGDIYTGDIVMFNRSDEELLALSISLTPYQPGTGDPSPTNIRPISGYSAVEVTRTGKNLLNVTATSRTYNGITMTVNEDGTITANGTATPTASFYLCDLTDAFSEGTYVLNGCPSGGTVGGYDLRMYQGSSGFAYDRGDGATFTGRSNVRAGLVVNNGKTVNNLTFKPMIRLASISDPTYEPYKSDTYPITLPQTVYGGTVNVLTGEIISSWAMIDSYAGEPLPGKWLSDRDVYTAGATPTTGAQVCYELAEPVRLQAAGTDVALLSGYNTIWSDAGTVEAIIL